MRYLWASVAAACFVGLCILSVHMTPTPAVTPGGAVELPSSGIWQIFFADVWRDYWYAIVPVIWVACFAVASLLIPSSRSARGAESVATNKSEN